MSSHITRRDMLKLLAFLPVLGVEWPRVLEAQTAPQFEQELPNVLVLVFDALSAKDISIYGYDRATTPNLARFAEKSTVYHAHYAGGNHTSPGVASILTGTYPWSHRAFHLHGTVADSYEQKNLFSLFAAAGYHTMAYSHNLLVTSLFHQFHGGIDVFKRTRDLCLLDDQFSDLVFSNDFNAAFWSEWLLLREGKTPPASLFGGLLDRMRRFIHKGQLEREYGDLFPRGIPHLHSLFFILEHAIDWIAEQLRHAPRPFLGYFHMLPPHEPYSPRREFIGRFDDGWESVAKAPHFFSEGYTDESLNQQRREYNEHIAYADAEFGRLYDSMVQNGVLDNTYVVVTSDHGEIFERGIRGHVTPVLYEPVVRVPLLISKPGHHRREDVYTPTSAVDLLPTLLRAVAQPAPDWCEGQVLPTFDGGGEGERSVFVVEAKSNPKHAPLTKGTVVLVKGQYKLIRYLGYGSYDNKCELYDLASDPEELVDIHSSQGSLASALGEELEARLNEVNE